MKVFIIGGTGLLGADAANMLIKKGHEVASIALPPLPEGANIPKEMSLTFANFFEMSDEDVKQMLTGFDAVVFAAGVDERVEFAPPVYQAYKKYNIEPVKRLFRIAKEVGVTKAVVLGSYFCHFQKTMPELKLYENHPYIRARIDQEKTALSFADENFVVSVLELPYIFGAQKGRKPVWELFVKMFDKMEKNIYFTKGGTTMVTVRQVSECIYGCLTKATESKCYPVGWYNKAWKEFITLINKAMGHPEKKIITMPTWIVAIAGLFLNNNYKKKNIEPGLNPVKFAKLQSSYTYIDKDIIQNELGVKEDDIDKAIEESISYANEILKTNKKVLEMKAE